MSYYKAFIRVVKSLTREDYMSFGSENIIEERMIEADNKDGVKKWLLDKYPQFFQTGIVYEKETKDKAQFFYVVIYPVREYELDLINEGEWKCDYCGSIHENKYVDIPTRCDRLFGDKLFCRSYDDHCLNEYKREYYKTTELPDDEIYIRKDSPIFIYKITEKSTGKCYVGKTRNEPFFRWWNHLRHSSSPFGIYLRSTKLNEWTFEVLDVLSPTMADTDVFKIESRYIIQYDSIKNGFNSVISSKDALSVNNEMSDV